MAAPAPQPQDLTNLANVKAAIDPNVATPSTSDAILQQYITRCSDSIATFCSRTFYARQYVENRNGQGTMAMRLKRTPAWLLSSVAINTYAIPISATANTGGWFLDDDGKFVYLRGGSGWPMMAPGFFPRGYGNVAFIYSAGYLTPGQLALTPVPTFPAPGPPAFPTDLEEATIEMTILMMRQRTRIGDTGVSIGTERLNFYLKSATAFAQETIEQYCDVSFPLS